MSAFLWEGEGKIDESSLNGLSSNSTAEQRTKVSDSCPSGITCSSTEEAPNIVL